MPGADRAGIFVAINGTAISDGVAVMGGIAGIRTAIINFRASNTLDQAPGAHRAAANRPPVIRRPLTSRAALQAWAKAARAETPSRTPQLHPASKSGHWCQSQYNCRNTIQ